VYCATTIMLITSKYIVLCKREFDITNLIFFQLQIYKNRNISQNPRRTNTASLICNTLHVHIHQLKWAVKCLDLLNFVSKSFAFAVGAECCLYISNIFTGINFKMCGPRYIKVMRNYTIKCTEYIRWLLASYLTLIWLLF
jgi:hypothetical protein